MRPSVPRPSSRQSWGSCVLLADDVVEQAARSLRRGDVAFERLTELVELVGELFAPRLVTVAGRRGKRPLDAADGFTQAGPMLSGLAQVVAHTHLRRHREGTP